MHERYSIINTRNLAHGFSVKLSPCMCSHSSCPGWRNGCNSHICDTYNYEDLSTYASSSLAYYAHVTVDSDKPCFVP